jgi:integron integrase
MKSIPKDIADIFSKRMEKARIPMEDRRNYLKWLRFYLDFCEKYDHPPENTESTAAFMHKLTEKRQSPAQRRQAAKSVRVYRDITKIKNSDHDLVSDRSSIDFHTPEDNGWDTVFQNLRETIRMRNYSRKTYTTYAGWIGRFEQFINSKHPDKTTMSDVKSFLTHLAVKANVAASTQNQAFNALLFLFRHVLGRGEEFDASDGIVRAKQKKYIPVVLTREEVDRVIANLRDPYNLVVKILYGCGLRLFECLNLRLHCLNVDENILTVHDGKGQKDRTVPLPLTLIPAIKDQIEKVCANLNEDLSADFHGVFMPRAAGKKYPNASRELPWQWLFPAKTLTYVPETSENRRYHLHESHVQKAIRSAVKRSKLTKRVTAHTFRHSFASHLLQANVDIRTIQQMLGHSDVRTTMIYTNTVKSRTLSEQISPLDMDPNLFA